MGWFRKKKQVTKGVLIRLIEPVQVQLNDNNFIFCHTERPGVFDVYKMYPAAMTYKTREIYVVDIGVFYKRMGGLSMVMKLDEKTRPEIGAYAFLWEKEAN